MANYASSASPQADGPSHSSHLGALGRPAIRAAHALIEPHVRRTPIVEVRGRDFGLGDCALVLKLEMLQHAGSFKTRGAFTTLLSRPPSQPLPEAGVVAASGGNHGVAVAFAAQRLGVRAKIFVPTIASPEKIARIRSLGAELVVVGERYADALFESERWVESSGALPVHAFDQVETLLGQGTVALELEEQAPRLDALLVAVGGGGLIGGIGAWYGTDERSDPATTQPLALIGVEPEGAPTLHDALLAGRPVDAPTGSVAADSLAPKRVGRLMFPIAQRSVARVLLVSDDEIRTAQRVLWESLRIVTEPGGATAFAAVLSGKVAATDGARLGVLICGANTNAVRFEM